MVTLLDWTPIFKWSMMVRLVISIKHLPDMYYDEIGLCAQNNITILCSIVNTNWEGLCACLKRESSL